MLILGIYMERHVKLYTNRMYIRITQAPLKKQGWALTSC